MSILTIQTDNADTGKLLKDLLSRISGVSVISENQDNVIGFKNGMPVFADDYKKEIEERVSKINNNSVKVYNSDEVLSAILKR